MSAGKQPKGSGGKRPAKKRSKKPSTFAELWKRMVKRDKGAEVPTEKTMTRAVAKAAKNLHLKKKERQQVTAVLAAELQRRAQEKTQVVADIGHVKAGDTAYPIPLQEGLFSEQTPTTEEEPALQQLDQATLDEAKKKAAADLELQRKSFMEKSGAATGSSASASAASGKSWSPEAYGAQPASITLEKGAVKEIASHNMAHILQQFLMEASSSLREAPNAKNPKDMTPDELVDLRRRDASAWDAVVRENTLVSYALSKPNKEEQRRAKKPKEKPRGSPLQFDDKVEVNKAPVGKDFYHNEKRLNESGSLKRK